MLSHLVLTVTGSDRPGIVQRVTEVLVSHAANLEESRMARLGGEFAAIMLVAVPEARAAGLSQALASLERESLRVVTRSTMRGPGAFQGYVPYEVSVSGADDQGIVHAVADFLAGHGVNIESLQTSVVNAPETGTALFSMEARVQAPRELALGELRRRLGEIGERLGVDVEVRFPS
ncbi:MAG: glycine cleavage system protein R [Gemmatimonadota bacterium]